MDLRREAEGGLLDVSPGDLDELLDRASTGGARSSGVGADRADYEAPTAIDRSRPEDGREAEKPEDRREAEKPEDGREAGKPEDGREAEKPEDEREAGKPRRRYPPGRRQHQAGEDELAIRRHRKHTSEAEVQANEEPWSGLDLRPSLLELHSKNKVVRSRALRRIHVRLWHAGADKMRKLLSLA
eukprot:2559017-Amphidinium_carterae.1